MTKRPLPVSTNIGNIIKNHRLALSLPNKSRQYFINNRIKLGFINGNEFSEKTLANIENGYNIPNLITLNYLATCLEVDFSELLREIKPFIPPR